MNPLEPSLQPHLPLRVSTCPRHPDQQFTGFCASCLRERLAGLDPASTSSSTLLHNSSTLKSIFRGSADRNKAVASSSSSAFLPELRRCKSFSGGRGENISSVLEPKRKSCDVRVRSTLWSLFNLDDERKGMLSSKEVYGEIEIETRDLGFGYPVIELKEEEEDEEEEEERGDVDEIRVSDDVDVNGNHVVEDIITEIEEELVGEEEELKTMKDHIDIESQNKKPQGRDLKEIAGSFWSAASIFSKKLQKWRRKQKMKKHAGGGDSSTMPKKRMGRHFRETQSEIADYGFGRRSCDTDPRLSLDAGRMSFDDPRYSWDEPRASWDGHLIGKMFPRLPPMVSVVEDLPVLVRRFDNQIPVEEPLNSIVEDETTPGGTAQTRVYYSDESQRRRRSLDRSSSIGQTATSMVAELDEIKSVSNAKVTPATSDYFHGAKVLVTDCDLRDSKSNSLKDDSTESFDSAFRDAASVVGCNHNEVKKSRSWSKGWNIWGLIHRRSVRKTVDEERYSRRNGVDRSLSGSWPELRREVNGKANGAFNRKDFRSNSSVSSRRSSNTDGLFGNMHSRTTVETNGHGRKRREDAVIERNRSARYSPSRLDNGLLRFYLTPLRGSKRSSSGKSRPNSSHSISRSVLRLY